MDEKLAVCSIVSKDHIEYLRTFCNSLLKYTPNFNRDYIVYFREGNLDQNDFDYLLETYKNFIFKKINYHKYSIALKDENDSNQTTGYKKGKLPRHKLLRKFSLTKIEMFKEVEYDQIIYFDIDMVCIKNTTSLFNKRYDEGLMACEDELPKIYNKVDNETYEKDHKVQGGLLIAGKKIINLETYNNLIQLLSKTNNFKRNDQSMFGEYFGNLNKLKKLDIKYNCGRKLIRDNFKKIDDVVIIHYPGSNKPYDVGKKKNNYDCSTYKYWHQIKNLSDKNIYLITRIKFLINLKILPIFKKLKRKF